MSWRKRQRAKSIMPTRFPEPDKTIKEGHDEVATLDATLRRLEGTPFRHLLEIDSIDTDSESTEKHNRRLLERLGQRTVYMDILFIGGGPLGALLHACL